MRILIVEDEILIAMVAETELAEAGHEVVGIAATFDAAVQLADIHRPDLALMDVRLASARDGIDAATEIHHRFGIPCVIASGSVDDVNIGRATAIGPMGWLVKPYSPDQLLQVVAKAALALAGGQVIDPPDLPATGAAP